MPERLGVHCSRLYQLFSQGHARFVFPGRVPRAVEGHFLLGADVRLLRVVISLSVS